MTERQVGVPAEVGQPLFFLFSHVIAVSLVAGGDGFEPLSRSSVVSIDVRRRVPDLVMVLDRVARLVVRTLAVGATADL